MHPKFVDEKGDTLHNEAAVPTQKWQWKKYLIYSSTAIIMAGLVVTAILVGIHMYTQAQKEIVEYTLTMMDGSSQDVSSDVTSNVVKYHVKDDYQEAWIVDDFNTDIKMTKIVAKTETNCYLTPLNRSTAMEPSKITKPSNSDNRYSPSKHATISYTTTGQPISDLSFLNDDALDLCMGISTYWMYPICEDNAANPDQHYLPRYPIFEPVDEYVNDYLPRYPYIFKRDDDDDDGKGVICKIYSIDYKNISIPCINGCCKTVCACNIKFLWFIYQDTMYCTWVYRDYCLSSNNEAFYFNFGFYEPTPGLICDDGNSTTVATSTIASTSGGSTTGGSTTGESTTGESTTDESATDKFIPAAEVPVDSAGP